MNIFNLFKKQPKAKAYFVKAAVSLANKDTESVNVYYIRTIVSAYPGFILDQVKEHILEMIRKEHPEIFDRVQEIGIKSMSYLYDF